MGFIRSWAIDFIAHRWQPPAILWSSREQRIASCLFHAMIVTFTARWKTGWAHLPHNAQESSFEFLLVWRLHVLFVLAWLFTGHSRFLPHSKKRHVTPYSKKKKEKEKITNDRPWGQIQLSVSYHQKWKTILVAAYEAPVSYAPQNGKARFRCGFYAADFDTDHSWVKSADTITRPSCTFI